MSEPLNEYYNRFYSEKLKDIHILDYPPDFHKRRGSEHYAYSISMIEDALGSRGGGKSARVLEVGVGTGAMLWWFRHKGIEPEGVDFSKTLIDLFLEKGFRVRHCDLNVSPLPFEAGQFDIVVSLDVIEHVINPISFMYEIHRVCAPRGHAIISTANSRTLKSIYTLLVKGRFPWTSQERDGWDCGHLHYFTTRDIAQLGADCGFSVERMVGITSRSAGIRGLVKKSVFSILPRGTSREFFAGSFAVMFSKRTGDG